MKKSFTFDGRRYWVVRKNPEDIPMAIAEKKAELKHKKFVPSVCPFKDYADKWLLTYKKPYVSKSSLSMYRNSIKIIDSYIGHRKIGGILPSDIQDIITSEYNDGKGKSSIDKTILTLKQIFRQAESDGTTDHNPTTTIRRPNFKPCPERALTNEEYEQILKVCETSKYGNWILFMLLCGLRPGETARLKKEHFNKDKGTMFIDGTKTAKAQRIIPLPEPLIDFVDGYNGDYLFCTLTGKPLTREEIQRRWRVFKNDWDKYLGAEIYRNRIVESKISSDVHLYTLRHTFATRMAAKVPMNILAETMGHSSINTTYKYYIHFNEENINTMRNAMGDSPVLSNA